MPVIAKWAHIENLLAELRKPEYEGLSDAEKLVKLDGPRPTGKKVYAEIPVANIAKVLFERDKLHVLQGAVATNLNAKRAAALLSLETVSPEDARAKEVLDALVTDGLLDTDDVIAIRDLAEEDEMGPSLARDIGIGEVYIDNMKQLNAYLDMTEAEVREDLAGILLIRCVRHLLAAGLSVEEYVLTEDFATRVATIADYTGVTDVIRLQELLVILVTEAQTPQVGER